MQISPEITFKNYEPSELVREEIARQVGKLERFSNRLTHCRVLVEAPENRHRHGGLFRINLEVSMPQHKEIAVTKTHGNADEHEHVLVAIRDAFDAATRQIEDAMRNMRKQTKAHVNEQHGKVTAFLAGDDAGFIETSDGQEIYFHRNAVLDESFSRLHVGSEVRFVEEAGLRGPQATTVRLIGKHHLA